MSPTWHDISPYISTYMRNLTLQGKLCLLGNCLTFVLCIESGVSPMLDGISPYVSTSVINFTSCGNYISLILMWLLSYKSYIASRTSEHSFT